MRIRQLDLEFFGRFTGKSFDFGPAGNGSDFHLIHGPNEAGKTTTMEAYLRLLYGFPRRGEPYDFRHQRKNLRVSGILEIKGAERRFTRLPLRSGALVDGNGSALPDSAIRAHLGGLAEEDYRNLLCLDDDTIEKGGEDIARARGDIGRLLFSAAAGLSNLSGVLAQVRATADSLYRRRASTTEMARLKKTLVEVEQQIRTLDVPASSYRKLKQAAEAARGQEDALRAERNRMRDLEARLRASRTALPLLAEMDMLRERIAPLHDFPGRLDINPEDLVRLLTDQSRITSDAERLDADIKALRQELAGIERRPEHLPLAGELAELDDLRSRFATADLDLGRRRRTLDVVLSDMRREVRNLGAPEDTDPLGLVVPAAAINRLEKACEAVRGAVAERAGEGREVAALAERRAQAEAACAMLEAEAGPQTGIGEVLERFSIDTLAPAHAAASQAVAGARTRLCEALGALAVRGQRFKRLPVCALTEEEAAELAGRHAALGQEIALCRRSLGEQEEDVAVRLAQITQLTAAGGLIADAEAHALLAERETLWAAHRAVLDAASADAFDAAMRQVDAAAEARLTSARELGQLRQAEQALAEAKARVERGAARLEEMKRARTAVECKIAEAAGQSGLANPVSPSAFLAWLERHAACRAAEQQLDHVLEAQRPVLERAERLTEALTPLVCLDSPDFDHLIATARRLAAEERKDGEAIVAARKELTGTERDMVRRKAELERLGRVAASAQAWWEALVAELFAGLADAETLAASLEPLRALRELDSQRMVTDRQISTMEEDQKQFAERVSALAARHGRAPSHTPPETFAALRELAAEAEAAETRHRIVTGQIEQKACAVTEARRRLAEINRQAQAFGALFPVSVPTETIAELRAAVATGLETIAARVRMAELETKVLTELSLPDLPAARAALDGETPAGLEAKAAGLRADLEDIEDRLRGAIEVRAAAVRDLTAVAGDADVARLVERKATLELQIEDSALTYLELDLGRRLAEEAIRRYRDAHRTDMMQATERAFSELTNGAYTRLRSQAEGEADILMLIDAEGIARRVEDLSKGTRFQLYLALRAAAYEQLAAQGIRLPFFCDDIFETFDEARTEAACRVMERIGRTGQAIYLTHHRHVVEIARTVCADEPIVHELV
jgi:uncharacterized protein YhaN